MVNENQKEAIETCQKILKCWLTTNDLKSPSHCTIIDEYIFDLEDDIYDDTNVWAIGKTMKELWNIIKGM